MADKYINYDWRCLSCETKYEALAKSDVKAGICPECKGESKRLISAPRMDPKMGVDPYSSMGDKWARNLEGRHKEAARRQRDHGDEV